MISKRAQLVFTPKLPEVNWESRPKVVQGQGVASRQVAQHQRLVGRVMLFVLAVLVCGIFYVWSRVQVVQLRYAMGELQKQTGKSKDEIQRLETEITRLKSPQRLEVFAKDGLHMVLPTSQNIVIVKEGGLQDGDAKSR
jgi:cell division protein FtsL